MRRWSRLDFHFFDQKWLKSHKTGEKYTVFYSNLPLNLDPPRGSGGSKIDFFDHTSGSPCAAGAVWIFTFPGYPRGNDENWQKSEKTRKNRLFWRSPWATMLSMPLGAVPVHRTANQGHKSEKSDKKSPKHGQNHRKTHAKSLCGGWFTRAVWV